MIRPKLGTIAIAVYFVTTPAAAAEITRRPQANGPDVITIHGFFIEQDDDKKFIEVARNIVQASVVLNSRGGYNHAAANIRSFIRFHEYETRVHKGAMCNSAFPGFTGGSATRSLSHRRLGVGPLSVMAIM
jgi:hypothetical protein